MDSKQDNFSVDPATINPLQINAHELQRVLDAVENRILHIDGFQQALAQEHILPQFMEFELAERQEDTSELMNDVLKIKQMFGLHSRYKPA